MRWLPSIALFACVAPAMAASDLEVARQALMDGAWDSALLSADAAATNAADRTNARLISLEALARLGNDVELRKRLSAWSDETDERFRFWRARAQVRVSDFGQARLTLEKPFTDPSLALPVKCLKACIMSSEGDMSGVTALLAAEKFDDKAGAAADDARLLLGEALLGGGKLAEAGAMLRPLAERANRGGMYLRAGYLAGFAEMADKATCTAGVARVKALLRSAPTDPISWEAHRVFADKLFALGDFAGAEDEYRRYLEIIPSAQADADVLDRRGRALNSLGRHSDAAGVFASAEQSATNGLMKAGAAFRQAEAFMAMKRYAEAAESFARSVGYVKDRRVRFFEADARERAGEVEGAAKIYGELAGVDDEWGAKALLRQASIEARGGRLSEAISKYGELISSNRLSGADMTSAYLGRGRACYREYRFKEAVEDFRVVAKRAPEMADGMRFLEALCLYGAGKDTDAKVVAEELMNSTKDDDLRADLRLWCAKYEYNKGKYDAARAHFEAFAAMRKGGMQEAEALLWAARCSSALTEYSKAVDLATQAANVDMSNRTFFAETLLVQGEATMELGRYAEAVQLFDRAVAQAEDGPSALKAAILKADALYAMGAGDASRYEQAVAAYRALPEGGALTPDRRIEVAFKIGRALEKMRCTKEAMDQYYRKVVLAYSEEVAKETVFSMASRAFFARSAFILADYYEAGGNFHAAKEVLDKVIAAGVPAAEEAKKRLAELKKKGGME